MNTTITKLVENAYFSERNLEECPIIRDHRKNDAPYARNCSQPVSSACSLRDEGSHTLCLLVKDTHLHRSLCGLEQIQRHGLAHLAEPDKTQISLFLHVFLFFHGCA